MLLVVTFDTSTPFISHCRDSTLTKIFSSVVSIRQVHEDLSLLADQRMDFSLRSQETSTQNDSITEAEEEVTFKPVTEFELMVLLYISASISFAGLISNVLSLSFFLLNWSKRLGEKFLALLNIFDLLVCLTGTIYLTLLIHTSNNEHHIFKKLVQASYYTSLECTGFVTTLMTVVRTFATYFPFSKPKEKYLAWSSVALFIYSAAKSSACVGLNYSIVRVYNILLLVSVFVTISVVFMANAFTMTKLLCDAKEISSRSVSPSARQNRKATVTIFILSACFCILNLLYGVVLCNVVVGKETITAMFRNTIVFTTVPLNSALNPVVYFFRKKEMRRFFSRNLSRCLCGRPEYGGSQASQAHIYNGTVAVNSLA